ncbi:binary toxin-like calcium binding domain-containing protein [Pelagibaculum spongiae]|uniref:Uncharacterized protein n=1 Tax=Pelagibaculum spongiae TaxID=2080658 RepID=A0A2V1H4L4_9GAMM|nr:binary toxin-like calcium binding domain-containing protein [Pelagibaculum spongiae]PVZ72137.1 hypothetical protein DC094_03730 [Pelagibaculum spongiae]
MDYDNKKQELRGFGKGLTVGKTLKYIYLSLFLVLSAGCNPKDDDSEAKFAAQQVEKLAKDNAQAYTLFNDEEVNFSIEVVEDGYTVSLDSFPVNGRVVGKTKGQKLQLRYVPINSYVGQDALTFKVVSDDTLAASSAKIQFVVLNPNQSGQDSDKDGLTDEDERNVYFTDPDLKDTDKDGLSDGAEVLSYKTSPVMPDTDGDSLNDWYEIVNLGFDSELNNYNFNPLIADVPILAIDLVSAPDIDLIQEDSVGKTSIVTTERSATETRGTEVSNSDTSSTAVEESSSEGWELGGQGGVSDGKLLAVISGGYSKSKSTTTTEETSYTWSTAESQENSQTLSRANSYENSRNLTTQGGELSIAARITNRGNMPFTVKNIFLSARQLDRQGSIATTFGNLSFDTDNNRFPEFSLSRGLSSGVMEFNTALPLADANSLLINSEQLAIDVSTVELVDSEGKAFAFNEVDLFNKNATVEIDYGGRKSLQKYRVAVVANPGNLTLPLKEVLADILKTPVQVDADRVISINGVGDNQKVCPGMFSTSAADCSQQMVHSNYWVALHSREVRGQVATTIYDNNALEISQLPEQIVFKSLDRQNFNDIRLQAGDLLKLIYIEDKDQDGVGIRQELAFGSNPLSVDSDNDGLTDKDEIEGWDIQIFKDHDGECDDTPVIEGLPAPICVPEPKKFENRQVYSSPIKADTDEDGVTDFDECKRNRFDLGSPQNASENNFLTIPEKCKVADFERRYPTDPFQVDTDQDGISDQLDRQPAIFNDLIAMVEDFVQSESSVAATIALPQAALVTAGQNYADYKVLIVSKKIQDVQKNIDPETSRFPVFSNDLKGKPIQCESGESESSCWTVEEIYSFDENNMRHRFSQTGLTEQTKEGERIDYHAVAWINGQWIKQTNSFSYTDVPVYELKLSVWSIRNLKCGDGDNRCDMLFRFLYNGSFSGILREREIRQGHSVGVSYNFSKEVYASDQQCLYLQYDFAEIDSRPSYSPWYPLKFCYSKQTESCASSGADGFWRAPQGELPLTQSCELVTPIRSLHGEDTQYSFKYNFKVQKKSD